MSRPCRYFVSDLHLLSRRTRASEVVELVSRTVKANDLLILGGDIFDFKWSTLPSLVESVSAAMRWLQDLLGRLPDGRIIYILGNHDAHPTFVTALDRLAFEQPRLSWQPFYVRLGKSVFLHGDVIDTEPNHWMLGMRRRRYDRIVARPKYAHWLYDLVVSTHLHRLAIHLAKRDKQVLKKLHRYLVNQGLDAEHGVRDVYFGHTHRAMDGVRFRGQTFHNGGSSIKGLTFRMIQVGSD